MARRLSLSLALLAAGVALLVAAGSRTTPPATTGETRKGGTLRMGSFEDVGPLDTALGLRADPVVDQLRDVREALQPP